MRLFGSPRLRTYAFFVVGLGAATAVLTVLAAGASVPARFAWLAGLLAVATVVAEFFPIRTVRNGMEQEATTATTFSVALLFVVSIPLAMLAQVVATLLADVRDRKGPDRMLFNAAQLAVCFAAAGGVYALLRASPVELGGLREGDMPAVLAACAVFFLVNTALLSVAAALHEGNAVGPQLVDDLRFEAPPALLLLGMAPVVVAAGQLSLAALPLVLLPFIAVHIAASAAVRERHRAEHDAVTDLPNRVAMGRRLERALDELGPSTHLAVLFMDLDRFKEINDTLGHRYGDELLELVATRLKKVMLPGETVARLGGDEFGFIIPGLDDRDSAQAAAARILGALHEPIEIQGIRLEVDASVGIAIAPEHGTDVDTLMQRADIAMYQAKEADRRSSTYSHEDDEHSFDRLALLGELRRAIDEDQLRLVWMPIRSLRDRTVESIEALVRWEHPTRGTVPPGMFVPYAERTGLVRPLLLEVVEQALRQGAAWRSAGKPVRVAVNLSTRNLLDLGLPEDIRHLLERHGMPADLLELEITESTIMADPERARMVSEELDAMGVRLSIDDFGTGYSSMAYLKDLPVRALKLDRSFVTQMLQGDTSASIVNSTIALATNLGIDVVAEGIEDEATEAALLEMGAGYGQGFVYGVPCPAGQVVFTEEGSWRL